MTVVPQRPIARADELVGELYAATYRARVEADEAQAQARVALVRGQRLAGAAAGLLETLTRYGLATLLCLGCSP